MARRAWSLRQHSSERPSSERGTPPERNGTWESTRRAQAFPGRGNTETSPATMAFQSLTGSLRPSLLSSSAASEWVCFSCRRNVSSFRRTRKALRVKPDASFAPSATETQDHIVFNPPSSAPNVYHTPQKFLPPNDPRRRLRAPTSSSTPPSTPGSASGSQLPSDSGVLPTTVRAQYEKKYHLTPAQVEEIRKLRKEDPKVWTRVKLAEKFACSQFFVSLCCSAPEIKEQRDKELVQIKAKWGRKKTEAREDRQTRKALWGRDA